MDLTEEYSRSTIAGRRKFYPFSQRVSFHTASAQVNRNPPEFQGLCEARAGARLIRAVPAGGIATAFFTWPEDQDLLFLWGAPFVEITNPHRSALGAGRVPGERALGAGVNHWNLGMDGPTLRPDPVTAPADASIPFRVKLLPDSDPRCRPGNAQRDAAIVAGRRRGEERRWNHDGLAWPFANARHQTDAAYYRGQCLAAVDATDDAVFHAPARYELVANQISHPPFSAGAVDVRMGESLRRLVDRQTKEVLAEEASFNLVSVETFPTYNGRYSFPASLNQCDGAERGRPTAIYALRPFAAAPTRE